MSISPLPARLARGVVALAAVVALVITGIGWTMVRSLEKAIAEDSGLSFSGDGADGAVDILLIGSDVRTDAQGNPLSEAELAELHAGTDEGSDNTDTILLVRVPNDGSSATVISIPRDTYIDAEDIGPTKINGVYGITKNTVLQEGGVGDDPSELTTNADGETIVDDTAASDELRKQAITEGRQALVHAVQDLTGAEIDHYAEIGMLGFVLLTDAVGGVQVCLNDDVDEPFSGAKFHQGVQTIGGNQALSFVRQRHDLPAGDLDRIVRQQVFMSQLTKQILSTGTLTDPGKLNSLNQAVSRSLVIDRNWNIVDFARQMQNVSGGNVRFETIPVTAIDAIGAYGESVVTVNPEQVKQFVAQFGGADAAAAADASGVPKDMQPGDVTVDVVNNTLIDGLAGEVQTYLAGEGYQPGQLSTAEGTYATSQIRAHSVTSPEADLVSKALGGLPIQSDFSIPEGTVQVIIAEDYTGPRGEASATGEESSMVQQSGSPLPPEIAERPTFDAGGSDVPCVN